MERRKFENAFKDAFKSAEVNPTEGAWTNIELELAKAEGDKMKRRLVFYKMLAAASITFTVMMIGVGYYAINSSLNTFNDLGIATHKSTEADSKDSSLMKNKAGEIIGNENLSGSITHLFDQKNKSPMPASPVDQSNEPKHNGDTNSSNQVDKATTLASATVVKSNSVQDNARFLKHPINKSLQAMVNHGTSGSTVAPHASVAPHGYSRKMPSLVKSKDAILRFPEDKVEADPVALMFAKLNQYERELAGEKDKDNTVNSEKLWTSVGFAAGGFNTVNPSTSATSSNALIASNSNVADKQAKASGVAYSFGVSMGTKISNRWVLQGGLNYLTQMSDYTATEAVSSDFENFKAASLNELRTAGDGAQESKLLSTAPYNVNNNVQFISVPMQAGYLVLNKKFGVQLNAGVSTDLFLQNTIDPEGGSLDKTTQGRGDESPYRSVNFSGLVGTELSYKFSQRYRIALNPGLRYPFNSIYKSDLGVDATPLTFDVGLRFRYIFH